MIQDTEWHHRWKEGNIGWQKDQPNEHLIKHFQSVNQQAGTILVPLCGKSKDLLWLSQQGWSVIGIEMVTKAIEDFFTELGVTPDISENHGKKWYRYENITIIQSDIFAMQATMLPQIDAIYDRAALVALPPKLREEYIAQKMNFLASSGKVLLLTYDMPVPQSKGPPYPVRSNSVEHLYPKYCSKKLLDEIMYTPETEAKLKERGVDWSKVQVWLIAKY